MLCAGYPSRAKVLLMGMPFPVTVRDMIDASCLTPERTACEAVIQAVMRALAGRVKAEGPVRSLLVRAYQETPREVAAHGLDGVVLPADPAVADLEDVRRTGQGDAEAYRRLVERHQDHVARILWRFDRDRRVHEELVQDVFVEAYLSLGRYRGKAPFAHWLTGIATRVGYQYWKEKARRRRTAAFDLREWEKVTDGDAVETLEPDRAAELLHRVLEQLAPRDRLVLTLRYLEQCDVAETARRTGWTKTMVKVQTMRARSRLRKLLEHGGMEWIE
jgi:RNA polymerase sigma-70 factor (ECF subfamily)